MTDRYKNYSDYVNAIGANGEKSLARGSLILYIGITVMILDALALIFKAQLSKTGYIVLPIVFNALIPVLSIWKLIINKWLADNPRLALLFHGVASLATSLVYLSGGWLVFRFSSVAFTAKHGILIAALSALTVMASAYFFHICRNGKKKKYSKTSIAAASTLAAAGALLAARLSKAAQRHRRVFVGTNYLMFSYGLPFLGLIELNCAIFWLSKYYVSVRYNIQLEV